jgi:hypothetical protein
MTGGLGEIPEPTVKVRMRENQRVAATPFHKRASRRLLPLFPPRDATSESR